MFLYILVVLVVVMLSWIFDNEKIVSWDKRDTIYNHIESLFISDPIYQPLRSGRIWNKVNF